jgi:tricorn protease
MPACPARLMVLVAVLSLAGPLGADEPAATTILLAESPSLSPDGERLVFAWRGDVWLAASTGGPARRLTSHPAVDRGPRFSPDGTRVAFTSARTGADQVHVLDLAGGEPVQVTRHTEGSVLQDWFPGGTALLVLGKRDHEHEHPERFFRVPAAAGGREELLLDAWGYEGALSPDGTRLAFVRHGTGPYRKGYRGAAAAQVWVAELATQTLTRVSEGPHDERWPLWHPDGRRLWIVSQADGTRNLVSVEPGGGARACLTGHVDDGVAQPTRSADGRVVVYRRLFGLERFEPGAGAPRPLVLTAAGEPLVEGVRRDDLAKASQATFTADGREVAFTAGGDVWVMDTELREPRRVTDTPEEERDPLFSADMETLLFVSDAGGRSDVWTAARAEPARWWWQNDRFTLARVTDDAAEEGSPRLTPDGKTLVYARTDGGLWKKPLAGGEAVRLVGGFDPPDFDLSPDGRWLAYTAADDDFNHDLWVLPLDLSRPAFNVSVHPDDEASPAWSPDGRVLAFTGRRWDRDRDICYVWLRHEDDEKDARERKLDKAVEKMKGRKSAKGAGAKGAANEPAKDPPEEPADKPEAKKKEDEKPVEVRIDFDRLTDRVRRVEIPDVNEGELLWSPDSKRLAVRASIKGQAGWHALEIPDDLAPKLLTASPLVNTRWLKEGDQLVGLADGVPTSVAVAGSKVTALPFRARRELDVGRFHRALFERAWQVMRDTWYDPRLNHRDWDALKVKYAPVAEATRLPAEIDVVVEMLLGELNGSHLGFGMPAPGWQPPGWRPVTGHLGARLLAPDDKPGRVVRDVVRGTPAAEAATRLEPGERLLAVDGTALEPGTDLDALLTGDPERELELKVRGKDGTERTVRLRPTTHALVRAGLYEEQLEQARAAVQRASDGRLGYLHVREMDWSSFQRFEADLYKVGHGKDGLVIDVRGNGGGFTADHLLTCLTQPRHATTVPRGGGPGYPQDRLVYAAWHKPIVVLIDQGSFSNAEIFAHAVRHLKRGRLVGVPTAGGVISTGGTTLMGTATLRLPFRGWFLPDGADMERNGCVPDVFVEAQPLDLARGVDRALDAAVKALAEDVAAFRARPTAPPRYASERDGPPPGVAPK